MSDKDQAFKTYLEQSFEAVGFGGRLIQELTAKFLAEIPTLLDSELTKRLHRFQCHPDWEYKSVEHPYKPGFSNPPEGHGWVDNVELDAGYTRYDNTEDHHFRRLKADKAMDDVPVYKLADIVMPKVTAGGVIEHVRGIFDAETIVGGVGPKCGLKKDGVYHDLYVFIPNDIFDGLFTRFVHFQRDEEVTFFTEDPKWPFHPSTRLHTEQSYLLLCLPGHPYRLLLDCKSETKEMWISTERPNGSHCNWVCLPEDYGIPLNPAVLNQELIRLSEPA